MPTYIIENIETGELLQTQIFQTKDYSVDGVDVKFVEFLSLPFPEESKFRSIELEKVRIYRGTWRISDR